MPKIVHIVLWKFTRPAGLTGSALDAHLTAAKNTIGRLVTETQGWDTASVGPPVVPGREKGFEYGLYSVFSSREALQTYAVSEAHVNIVKAIAEFKEDLLAYDWEI